MSGKKLSIQLSVAWNSIGSIFYLGCQWLLTVLVVRISGLKDAGILSLAMSVCNIWYCIAVYGMRNFQVSDTKEKYANGVYVGSRIITCGVAFVGCLIYTLSISYNRQQKLCIILYYLFKSSEIFFDVYAGIFQKQWRLDYAGKSMIFRGCLSLISFVIILGLTKNITYTIACMAAVCMAEVFIYDIPRAKKIANVVIDFRLGIIKKLLIECFPLVVYTLLSSLIATIPRLIMERLLGTYELGIYGSVATPTLIIQMAATYVFNPFVTLFAELYYRKERKKFLQILMNCTCVLLFISLIGVIGGKLLGKWGLQLLYGTEVANYVELLIPLILCTVLTAFSWLLCGVLTAIREFKGLVIGNLFAVIVSFASSFYFEHNYGMQGASLSLALAVLVEIIILYAYMVRKMKKQFY